MTTAVRIGRASVVSCRAMRCSSSPSKQATTAAAAVAGSSAEGGHRHDDAVCHALPSAGERLAQGGIVARLHEQHVPCGRLGPPLVGEDVEQVGQVIHELSHARGGLERDAHRRRLEFQVSLDHPVQQGPAGAEVVRRGALRRTCAVVHTRMSEGAQALGAEGAGPAPRPAVESRPMPHLAGMTHRVVELPGLRMHLAEAGAGPPLLLLHGSPKHWWQWAPVIPALGEHFHLLMPDLRG